jgi:hypothetical protein
MVNRVRRQSGDHVIFINVSHSKEAKIMPLVLPTANFANWQKYMNNYFYPPNNSDDHIHVVASINPHLQQATITSVSIKIGGENTNLRVGTALNGFKFHENTATFPAGELGEHYKEVLRATGLSEP